MSRCRGSILVRPEYEDVKGPDGTVQRLLFWNVVGGGTIMEAIMLGCQLKPNNKFVQHVKEHGVSDCVILKETTPEKTRTWLKKEHNQWHRGSTDTLVEDFDTHEEAAADWKARCLDETLSKDKLPKSGSASYDSVMKRHITTNFKQPYANWDYSPVGDYGPSRIARGLRNFQDLVRPRVPKISRAILLATTPAGSTTPRLRQHHSTLGGGVESWTQVVWW